MTVPLLPTTLSCQATRWRATATPSAAFAAAVADAAAGAPGRLSGESSGGLSRAGGREGCPLRERPPQRRGAGREVRGRDRDRGQRGGEPAVRKLGRGRRAG